MAMPGTELKEEDTACGNKLHRSKPPDSWSQETDAKFEFETLGNQHQEALATGVCSQDSEVKLEAETLCGHGNQHCETGSRQCRCQRELTAEDGGRQLDTSAELSVKQERDNSTYFVELADAAYSAATSTDSHQCCCHSDGGGCHGDRGKLCSCYDSCEVKSEGPSTDAKPKVESSENNSLACSAQKTESLPKDSSQPGIVPSKKRTIITTLMPKRKRVSRNMEPCSAENQQAMGPATIVPPSDREIRLYDTQRQGHLVGRNTDSTASLGGKGHERVVVRVMTAEAEMGDLQPTSLTSVQTKSSQLTLLNKAASHPGLGTQTLTGTSTLSATGVTCPLPASTSLTFLQRRTVQDSQLTASDISRPNQDTQTRTVQDSQLTALNISASHPNQDTQTLTPAATDVPQSSPAAEGDSHHTGHRLRSSAKTRPPPNIADTLAATDQPQPSPAGKGGSQFHHEGRRLRSSAKTRPPPNIADTPLTKKHIHGRQSAAEPISGRAGGAKPVLVPLLPKPAHRSGGQPTGLSIPLLFLPSHLAPGGQTAVVHGVDTQVTVRLERMPPDQPHQKHRELSLKSGVQSALNAHRKYMHMAKRRQRLVKTKEAKSRDTDTERASASANRWSVLKCQHCPKVCTSRLSFTLHSKIHNRDGHVKCPLCTATFTDVKPLKEHLRTSHPGRSLVKSVFKCQHCPKVCTSKLSFTLHSKIHNRDGPVKCPLCTATFTDVKPLKEHMRTSHPGRSLIKEKKVFRCPHCSKVCTQKLALVSHSKIHNRDSPAKCQLCTASFPNQRNLKHHMRATHPDRWYARKKKIFRCEHCPKVCIHRLGFVRHLEIHRRDGPVKCDVCTATFSTTDNLRVHKRTTHSSGWREQHVFQCNHCPKLCTSKAALDRHSKIHNRNYPFVCLTCKATFPNTWTVMRHMRSVHRLSFKEASSGFTAPKIVKEQKIFECHHCLKACSSKRELNCHLRIHDGKDPFLCSLCMGTFPSRLSLYQHKRDAHKNGRFPTEVSSEDGASASEREDESSHSEAMSTVLTLQGGATLSGSPNNAALQSTQPVSSVLTLQGGTTLSGSPNNAALQSTQPESSVLSLQGETALSGSPNNVTLQSTQPVSSVLTLQGGTTLSGSQNTASQPTHPASTVFTLQGGATLSGSPNNASQPTQARSTVITLQGATTLSSLHNTLSNPTLTHSTVSTPGIGVAVGKAPNLRSIQPKMSTVLTLQGATTISSSPSTSLNPTLSTVSNRGTGVAGGQAPKFRSIQPKMSTQNSPNTDNPSLASRSVRRGGQSSYQCQLCPKTCPNQKGLAQHMVIHDRQEPVGCNLCSATFPNHHLMRTHLSRVHGYGRRGKCRSRTGHTRRGDHHQGDDSSADSTELDSSDEETDAGDWASDDGSCSSVYSDAEGSALTHTGKKIVSTPTATADRKTDSTLTATADRKTDSTPTATADRKTDSTLTDTAARKTYSAEHPYVCCVCDAAFHTLGDVQRHCLEFRHNMGARCGRCSVLYAAKHVARLEVHLQLYCQQVGDPCDVRSPGGPAASGVAGSLASVERQKVDVHGNDSAAVQVAVSLNSVEQQIVGLCEGVSRGDSAASGDGRSLDQQSVPACHASNVTATPTQPTGTLSLQEGNVTASVEPKTASGPIRQFGTLRVEPGSDSFLGDVVLERQREFKCPHCPRICPNKTGLVQHMAVHKRGGALKCGLCSATFINDRCRKKHLKSAHRISRRYLTLNSISMQYLLGSSNSGIDTDNTMATDVVGSAQGGDTADDPTHSDVRGKRGKDLDHHMAPSDLDLASSDLNVTPVYGKKSVKNSDSVGIPFSTDIGSGASRENVESPEGSIRREMKLSSGKVRFCCDQCPWKFLKEYRYHLHMVAHLRHEEIERYIFVCPFCKEARFKTERAVDYHVDNRWCGVVKAILKMTKQMPRVPENIEVMCSACRGVYSSLRAYGEHAKGTGCSKRAFRCVSCAKSYVYNSSLLAHRRLCHPDTATSAVSATAASDSTAEDEDDTEGSVTASQHQCEQNMTEEEMQSSDSSPMNGEDEDKVPGNVTASQHQRTESISALSRGDQQSGEMIVGLSNSVVHNTGERQSTKTSAMLLQSESCTGQTSQDSDRMHAAFEEADNDGEESLSEGDDGDGGLVLECETEPGSPTESLFSTGTAQDETDIWSHAGQEPTHQERSSDEGGEPLTGETQHRDNDLQVSNPGVKGSATVHWRKRRTPGAYSKALGSLGGDATDDDEDEDDHKTEDDDDAIESSKSSPVKQRRKHVQSPRGKRPRGEDDDWLPNSEDAEPDKSRSQGGHGKAKADLPQPGSRSQRGRHKAGANPYPPPPGLEQRPTLFVLAPGSGPIPLLPSPPPANRPPPGIGPPPTIRPPPGIGPPPTIRPPPGIGPPPTIRPPPGIGPAPTIRPPPGIGPPPTIRPPPGIGPPPTIRPPPSIRPPSGIPPSPATRFPVYLLQNQLVAQSPLPTQNLVSGQKPFNVLNPPGSRSLLPTQNTRLTLNKPASQSSFTVQSPVTVISQPVARNPFVVLSPLTVQSPLVVQSPMSVQSQPVLQSAQMVQSQPHPRSLLRRGKKSIPK